MRNIRLDLEYDGRNYCGWQWQPNQPTIEGTLKRAIESIVNHPVVMQSSGRTDSGVHAEQHVAHFFSETTLQPQNLLLGINALLPEDIVVYRVMDMPEAWSARYDALERKYRYTFYCHPVPSAFYRHWSYWIKHPLDVPAMQEASRYLVGEHDFSAFRSTHCDAKNPVRTLLDISLVVEGPLLHVLVTGHAFLRHQVRILAGTLLDVGRGRLQALDVKRVLESKDRSQAGDTLPAHGLTLVSVRYEGDEECFAPGIRKGRFNF